MATYYYTLINTVDNYPYSEKRATGDFASDAAARSWIATNDIDYVSGQTQILTRRISALEASDRGYNVDELLGDIDDAAADPDGDGTVAAKLRLFGIQLDDLSTLVNTVITDIVSINTKFTTLLALPVLSTTPVTAFTNFSAGVITIDGTAQEIKVGGSRLTGRLGFFITNLHASDSLYIGGSSVTTSGSTIGLELLPGETKYFPFGDVAVYQIGTNTNTYYLMEVK